MGKLSDEEKATLAALSKKAEEPDDDGDYEVEFWEETPEGHRRGGRLPYNKGKGIYGKWFPDLFADKPPEGKEKGKESDGGDGTPPQTTSQKYFGNK